MHTQRKQHNLPIIINQLQLLKLLTCQSLCMLRCCSGNYHMVASLCQAVYTQASVNRGTIFPHKLMNLLVGAQSLIRICSGRENSKPYGQNPDRKETETRKIADQPQQIDAWYLQHQHRPPEPEYSRTILDTGLDHNQTDI